MKYHWLLAIPNFFQFLILFLLLSVSVSLLLSLFLFLYKLLYLTQILIHTLAYLICIWLLSLLTTKHFHILRVIDALLSINVGEGLFQFVLIDNLENLFSSNIISNMPYLLLHLPYPKKCFPPKIFSGFFFSLLIITAYQTLFPLILSASMFLVLSVLCSLVVH